MAWPDLVKGIKFYIYVGYGGGAKGCKLWDATVHKSSVAEICTMRSCSRSQREICLQT
jgi:hypothetical protein